MHNIVTHCHTQIFKRKRIPNHFLQGLTQKWNPHLSAALNQNTRLPFRAHGKTQTPRKALLCRTFSSITCACYIKGHCITNSNRAHQGTIRREIPQNFHTCALFHPPKWVITTVYPILAYVVMRVQEHLEVQVSLGFRPRMYLGKWMAYTF